MEKREITGLSIDDKIGKVIISEIDNYQLFISLLYGIMSHNNLKFSMLNYNKAVLSFVVSQDDIQELQFNLSKLLKQVSFKIEINERLACLTLVGLGFTSTPILSIDVLALLAQARIAVDQSVASNLSFGLLIEQKDIKYATELLAKKFEI